MMPLKVRFSKVHSSWPAADCSSHLSRQQASCHPLPRRHNLRRLPSSSLLPRKVLFDRRGVHLSWAEDALVAAVDGVPGASRVAFADGELLQTDGKFRLHAVGLHGEFLTKYAGAFHEVTVLFRKTVPGDGGDLLVSLVSHHSRASCLRSCSRLRDREDA